ncbi:hypothetical protein DICPUDRAFT_33844 [Dictyostelium purpureum]|uniref:DUF829 domain-containing protein n=1 Tax=Dictyostelium purpureum TaxID=5786 RepID=F0ZLM0_DICPU|nr:uncharacterized protein DICPUDRAFT_33844 [Dictyostelium purpureum]EGC35179.1 hypothetical protein DICPUDRAFT_33844 [Dictyostelium purpureum]|eukprot:XP_003288317.1 hypothetical protein DICPUDRAFT_33844 [Dictyostelium purpureum]
MIFLKQLLKNQTKLNFVKATPLVSQQQSNNQILNKNEKSLVVVLGWLEGKEKDVNKYTQDWANQGYNTLTNYYPLIDVVIPPIMTPKSLIILDKINEIVKDDPKIDSLIFHVLSNGGALYYSRTLHFIETDEKYKHLHKFIKGTLLDSNPSTDTTGVKQALSLAAPNDFIKQLLMKLYPVINFMLSRDFFKYFKIIYSPKNKWNHLFIYSKNDEIINYEHVNSTINKLKNNIKNEKLIDSICFDKSAHVNHKRLNKDQYNNKFLGFINKLQNI